MRRASRAAAAALRAPLLSRAASTGTPSDAAAAGADEPSGALPEQDPAELLPFLACPLTKAPLRYDAPRRRLVCDELGVAYGISAGGVPQLVPHMGEVLDEQELAAAAAAAAGQRQREAGGAAAAPS